VRESWAHVCYCLRLMQHSLIDDAEMGIFGRWGVRVERSCTIEDEPIPLSRVSRQTRETGPALVCAVTCDMVTPLRWFGAPATSGW
jgi:hypothetical protein